MPEWELMTINDYAVHLKVHPQTVRNWINDGSLASVKVGRARRIPRDAAVVFAGGSGYELPELMTVEEVAQRLARNTQTVRNWIDDEKLPAIYVGRLVRIKRAVVDQVVASGLPGVHPDQRRPLTATDFWLGDQPVGAPVFETEVGSHSLAPPASDATMDSRL
jgi:excisionase family DNA binding protein